MPVAAPQRSNVSTLQGINVSLANRQRTRAVDLRLLRRIVQILLGTAIRQNPRVPRGFWCAAFSSSPHDEGVGRGPKRGAIQTKRASSPRPSPPSDGGEGVDLVAAPPRCELLQIEQAELGICLVATPEMTRLNETFLRHAGSTDVIAFDYSGRAKASPSPIGWERAGVRVLHGEIFICVDEAVLQARRFRT